MRTIRRCRARFDLFIAHLVTGTRIGSVADNRDTFLIVAIPCRSFRAAMPRVAVVPVSTVMTRVSGVNALVLFAVILVTGVFAGTRVLPAVPATVRVRSVLAWRFLNPRGQNYRAPETHRQDRED